jgi:hypothetical protein
MNSEMSLKTVGDTPIHFPPSLSPSLPPSLPPSHLREKGHEQVRRPSPEKIASWLKLGYVVQDGGEMLPLRGRREVGREGGARGKGVSTENEEWGKKDKGPLVFRPLPLSPSLPPSLTHSLPPFLLHIFPFHSLHLILLGIRIVISEISPK